MQFFRVLWAVPATMQAGGGPVHLTEADWRECFNRTVSPGNPGDCHRLVCDVRGAPVAELGYQHMDPATMRGELNIKIASSFRARGLAKSAARQFLEFYFRQGGGRVLIDDVAESNFPGQRFLTCMGFIPTDCRDHALRSVLSARRFMESNSTPLAQPDSQD